MLNWQHVGAQLGEAMQAMYKHNMIPVV